MLFHSPAHCAVVPLCRVGAGEVGSGPLSVLFSEDALDGLFRPPAGCWPLRFIRDAAEARGQHTESTSHRPLMRGIGNGRQRLGSA